jgi:lambda repressor-like predicted transcriptional regulator
MKKSSYCADIASETLPNVFSRETRKREALFYDDRYDNISETLGTQ